ncbi:MAG: PTS sugar transporter subunit IIA [Syntrophotaleaceae bacterium]
MVGIVVATHANLSQALVAAAEMILGSLTHVEAININREDGVDVIRQRFADAIERVGEAGGGILILTDLFGGTPSNIGFSFLDPGKVEVVTGVNLPMLLKACNVLSDLSLAEIAADLKDHARSSIMVASEVLSG